MNVFVSLFLLTELLVHTQSKILDYSEPRSPDQPRTLESMMSRRVQDNVPGGYGVIGLEKHRSVLGDIVKSRERFPPEDQENTRLKALIDWLSMARSDALSQPHTDSLRVGPDQPITAERLRRRKGGRRRGGRRRRGRGKRRRYRTNRGGKGRRSLVLGANSRPRRSQERSFVFNEHGRFKGLPFGLDPIIDIIPISRENGQVVIVGETEALDQNTNLSFDRTKTKPASSVTIGVDTIPAPTSMTQQSQIIKERQPSSTRTTRLNSKLIVQPRNNEQKWERTGNQRTGVARRRGQHGPTTDLENVTTSIAEGIPTENVSIVIPEELRRRRVTRGRDVDKRRRWRGGRRGGKRKVGSEGDISFSLLDDGLPSPRRSAHGSVVHEGRVQSGKRRREKRALPKDGFSSLVGSFAVPKGKLYRWTRNLPGMNSVNEFAFSSTDRDVAVVMSFDPGLENLGISNGATLYDFTGRHGVMALRPRVPASPCYLLEASQTFEEILAELTDRNSSSVRTNTERYLDGSGNPISEEEQEALLQQTPSLRRQCRGRSIVRATPFGMHPVTQSGPTMDIKLLTLDNEVTMTVRVQATPDASKVSGTSFPGQWFRRWGRLRSVLGRGSGRLAQWIGQGRWGRGQAQGQGRDGDRVQGSGSGNQTTPVNPVPPRRETA